MSPQVDSTRESVQASPNLGGGWSWFESKVQNGFNRLKDFGRWLITPANRNYYDHSDKVDFKIAEAQESKTKGSQIVDTSVVDYKTPETQLNLVEKWLKRGRGSFSVAQFNFLRIIYETIGGLGSCLANEEWTDADLGHMPLNATTYCDIRCRKFLTSRTLHNR